MHAVRSDSGVSTSSLRRIKCAHQLQEYLLNVFPLSRQNLLLRSRFGARHSIPDHHGGSNQMSDLKLNLTDDQIRIIYGTTSALIDDLVRWTGKSRATIERILTTGFDGP